LLVAGALWVAVAAVGVVTFTSGVETVRIEDRCDPDTFNAVLGAGACVGDGDVTFDELVEEVMEDGAHGAWRFHPDEFHVKAGESINAHNIGGETHTFTEVKEFGAGFVPEVNALSDFGDVAPECVNFPAVLETFAAPNETTDTISPGAGRHRFQCCIHPWMRTEVTVRKR
jgi:plastocyanin